MDAQVNEADRTKTANKIDNDNLATGAENDLAKNIADANHTSKTVETKMVNLNLNQDKDSNGNDPKDLDSLQSQPETNIASEHQQASFSCSSGSRQSSSDTTTSEFSSDEGDKNDSSHKPKDETPTSDTKRSKSITFVDFWFLLKLDLINY